jgi:hypothetical protein
MDNKPQEQPKSTELMSEMLESLNLQKPIFSSQQSSSKDSSFLDHTSVKNMLHVWVYKLLNNLDDENRELLKFFDLPAQPQTDEDYFKLITSLKIIEHCSSAVEYSSIWLLLISVFLMWILRTAGTLIGDYFVDDEQSWSAKMETKLDELNAKINNPAYVKKVRYKYLSYQVQQCYHQIRRHKNIEIPSTHPAFSIVSDVLGEIVTYARDLFMDPLLVRSKKRKMERENTGGKKIRL